MLDTHTLKEEIVSPKRKVPFSTHGKDNALFNLTHAVMNLTESIEKLQSRLDSLDTPKAHEIDPELKELERLAYLPFLKKDQVCRLLQIAPSTLNKLISYGDISFSKKRGIILFSREDINEFIEKNKQA